MNIPLNSRIGCIRRPFLLRGLLLLHVLALQIGGFAANVPGYKLEPTRPYYLLGNPIKVFLATKNTGKQDAFFSINSLGLPDLTVRLISPNGEALGPNGQERYSPGVQGATGFKPLYRYKAGEEVKFSFDVNELFVLTAEGKYKIELMNGNTMLADTEINLIASEVVARSKFQGSVQIFARLSVRPEQVAAAILEGNAVVSKANVNGKELWFLNIEGNKVAKREASNLFEPFSVLSNTTIQKTALDFKGQLWIVLDTDTKHSLVIWNLATGFSEAVIPWQTANIEMGIISNIVIAGIEGQTKISTLSYGVAPQAK